VSRPCRLALLGAQASERTAVATGGSAESAIYGRGDGIDWYNEVSLSLMTGVDLTHLIAAL
jgi:hypothetical protein